MDILSKQLLSLVAGRFKLLSSPTRLEILQHICEEEKTVGTLVNLTGHKQANVSRHLGLLDRAGVVTRRVDGNHVYYRVSDASIPRLCEVMRESIQTYQMTLKASIG